jgi:hypothetical protein
MKINLLFCLFVTLCLCPKGNAQSDFKFIDTLAVNGINKTNAFENCLEWVATKFKSAENVIQYQNKERGKMVLKGNLNDEFRTDFTLAFTITENGWNYAYSGIKSLQYNYDYIKGDSECYTKQCKSNIKKWKDTTAQNLYLIVKEISNSINNHRP